MQHSEDPSPLPAFTARDWQAAFDHLPLCVGIYTAVRDARGHIVDFRVDYVNEAACQNNKLTRDEQLGRRLNDLLPGHRESGLFGAYCAVVDTGCPFIRRSFPYRDLYGDRVESRIFDIHVRKYGDGFLATWHRVDGAIHVEREDSDLLADPVVDAASAASAREDIARIREGHAQFRAIFNQMTEGLMLFDGAGELLEMNPAALAIHGFESAEQLNAHIHALRSLLEFQDLRGRVLPHREWPMPRALRGEVFHRLEVQARRIDTGKTWIGSYGGSLVCGPDGKPSLVILTVRDVTAQKQFEAALAESEQRFRTLADNMSQFAWMADEKGWIFWYNRRWYDYTGTTLEQMQGWGWKKVHHPDHVDRVVKRIQHSWDTGEPWEDVFPLRSQDGDYRWFLSRALPIRDADGKVVRWFGTNTDVTEQREHENKLRMVMA
ncbi:MAG TPA: PAS domain-containing protein, partial [Phycisphaerae bacterium]|nr:PAS domain-containing protein [Phycisphaerae bacterium]